MVLVLRNHLILSFWYQSIMHGWPSKYIIDYDKIPDLQLISRRFKIHDHFKKIIRQPKNSIQIATIYNTFENTSLKSIMGHKLDQNHLNHPLLGFIWPQWAFYTLRWLRNMKPHREQKFVSIEDYSVIQKLVKPKCWN